MGRNNKQAELIKRHNAGTKSSSIRAAKGRPLLRRHLRTGLMLCFTMIALHGLALDAPGQNTQASPVPNTVTVDVAKPPKEPLQFRFAKEPKAETALELKGNGQDWSFVNFDQLPNGTFIRAKNQPEGYEDSEAILVGKWYWFKNRLPLIVDIKESARPPINISFWFGTPNKDADKLQAKELKPEEMRAFIATHEIKQVGDKMFLGLTWDAPATAAASPSVPAISPTVSPTASPQTESTWWNDPFGEISPFGLVIILGGLALIIIILILVVSDWRAKHPRKRPISLSKGLSKPQVKRTPAPAKPTAEADMYASLGLETARATNEETMIFEQPADVAGHAPTSQETESVDNNDLTLPGQTQPAQEVHKRQVRPGDVSYPPSKSQPPAASPTPTATPSSGQDGRNLVALQDKVRQLEDMLSRKVDRDEKLTQSAWTQVNGMLTQSENGTLAQVDKMIRQSVGNAVKPIEELMSEHAENLQKKLNETVSNSERSIARVNAEEAKVKQQFEELSKALRDVETRMQTRLDALETALARRSVPDSFYSRILGAALGQHIEALQDGNFERLMVEQVNQFFQNGVKRGEGLQEVSTRAEGITGALRDVSAYIEKLKPQATEEARPHMQRFEKFVDELNGLQAQLQSRRGIIETTLRIPASMHSEARQTFLDELGRGIKREIDKLNEPESYFDGELERLITADLIAIVDICDKKVTQPGTRPELEVALKRLFDQAGLRQILPRQGEQFKAAEQDLIQTVPGSGASLTVARVITRGFYYKHGDNETLLRKASVEVNR
ncbi:MAG TPA: hypothetical protein VM911_23105 [Pyrinomonadaceae bacterium]|jgi:chromatin segregation and condensation protein Rec8/ScpA/Scc1 (kleisin family)|nr:hypothetical protein [Pyrinomonadaceae bacterium]